MILLLLLSSLWNSTLRTKRTSLFQRLFKSSSKIIRDLIKLQSVPAVAKFYLSGTCTNMSSHVECKSMGKGSIAISVEKLPRPLVKGSSTWSELIRCTPENSVGSSLLVLTQNVWWCTMNLILLYLFLLYSYLIFLSGGKESKKVFLGDWSMLKHY